MAFQQYIQWVVDKVFGVQSANRLRDNDDALFEAIAFKVYENLTGAMEFVSYGAGLSIIRDPSLPPTGLPGSIQPGHQIIIRKNGDPLNYQRFEVVALYPGGDLKAVQVSGNLTGLTGAGYVFRGNIDIAQLLGHNHDGINSRPTPQSYIDPFFTWSGTEALGDVTITGTTTLAPGEYHYRTLTLNASATLRATTTSSYGRPLVIRARTIVMAANARIAADYAGPIGAPSIVTAATNGAAGVAGGSGAGSGSGGNAGVGYNGGAGQGTWGLSRGQSVPSAEYGWRYRAWMTTGMNWDWISTAQPASFAGGASGGSGARGTGPAGTSGSGGNGGGNLIVVADTIIADSTARFSARGENGGNASGGNSGGGGGGGGGTAIVSRRNGLITIAMIQINGGNGGTGAGTGTSGTAGGDGVPMLLSF